MEITIEKKYNFVYQTKCLVNDKTYIGVHSTNNLLDGYLGSGDKLKFSIKKHGKENFKIEILDFFDTKKEAYEEEKYLVNTKWIESRDNYNVTLGGCIPPSWLGRTMSEESKKKISISNTGKVRSEQARINIGNAGRGRKKTPEQLEAQSKALKGINKGPKSAEHMAKIVASRRANGPWISEEQKKKLSIAGMGRKASKETKEKRLASRRKYVCSEETKVKFKMAHAMQTEEEKAMRYSDRSFKVSVLSKETGDVIYEFSSVSKAAVFFKISFHSITAIANNTYSRGFEYDIKIYDGKSNE